jgi:hypothetical protein
MTEPSDGAAPGGSAEADAVHNAEEIVSAPDQVDGQETQSAEPEQPEEIEFDFGGNKLRIPKGTMPDEIAEKLDQFTKGTWSDYTRKSQEVAEQRKALAAEAEYVARVKTLTDEGQRTFARGLQLREEVEQLAKVDLQALWQSQPDQARRVSDLLSAKQAEFQRVVAQVGEYEAQVARAEQQAVARREQDGRDYVAKTVKGWSDTHAAEAVAYAVKHGVPEEQAKQWARYPREAIWAWKAAQFDKLQAAAKAPPKPAAAPTAPVAAVRGRPAPAAPDPDSMSDDQWLKWRNAQLAKRGRR